MNSIYFRRYGDLLMPNDEIDISADIAAPDEEPVMTEGVEEPESEVIQEETEVEEPAPEHVPEPEPTPVESEEIVLEPAVPAGPKTMNRWIVVVGAIMIQLALGAIYSWSVFTPILKESIADGGVFGYTTTETQIIFSVGLLTFAVVMVLAGKLQAKFGPRKIALIGGLLLGTGYIAASFVGEGAASFLPMLITIGIIGGAGIGLAYVVPIAVCMKWFPDKKGLISGFAVAGFGFGATIWVKLAGSWGNLLESQGIHGTFLIYGIIFLLMVVLGSLLMVNPPAGYKPKGWNPPEPKEGGSSGYDFMPKQMLKTPQFWMIFFMFTFGALAGLMVIGVIKLFGIDALTAAGVANASAIAGTAMAVFYAIFNGIGRIVWGGISDKIGTKKSFMAMFAFQALMMFMLFQFGKAEYTLYLAAALIGFNFGGNFSLFPTATAEYFGTKNIGQNYGFTFLSYGVGGVIGPVFIAGYFKDQGAALGVDAWAPAFIIAGVLCVIAVVIALMLKAPKPPKDELIQ